MNISTVSAQITGTANSICIGTTKMSMITPNGKRKSYGVSKRLNRRFLQLPCTSQGFSASSRFEFSLTCLLMSREFQPSKPAAGVAPATGPNAIPASASGCPSLPSAGPSDGYVTVLAAATVLHSDDENLNRMWPVAARRKKRRNAERQKIKPPTRRRRGSEKRYESDGRWNPWAATGNGNDWTKANVGETIDAAGIEATTIGADKGVSAGVYHLKTDVGWKTGTATVSQPVLLDVPDPWTENVVVQEEMNHTTKWPWPESEKEIVSGGRRVAGERRWR